MKHSSLKKALENLGFTKVVLVKKTVYDPSEFSGGGIIRSWAFEMNGRCVSWSEEDDVLRMHPYCITRKEKKAEDFHNDYTHGYFPATIKAVLIWLKN